MYVKFLYVSPKNLKDDRYLIGARCVFEDASGITVKEIYVGEAYNLNDFLDKKDLLEVKASRMFIFNKYTELDAKGIVYFPNVKKFCFLTNNEIVVSNKNELNDLIGSFKEAKGKSLIREK